MKIAVIGGGISGLSASWLLSEAHEVHLFESEGRLGGHAHTVDVSEGTSSIPVDTGFLVYNELTYPNLIAFFHELGVETIASDMSLSIISRQDNIEWAGSNLNTIFGQRKNFLSPGFLFMLFEIIRFGRQAELNLSLARRHGWTLGELLQKKRYSKRFIDLYLLPIAGAIWSTPEGEMLSFPAETFLTFFMNHKLLQINDRPKWRTVKNGSRQYVEKAAKKISRVFLSAKVTSVVRKDDHVLVFVNNEVHAYDKVIFATHAPISKRILKEQSEKEAEILGAILYESNRTVLHSNPAFMPSEARCWSSWNVLGTGKSGYRNKISLTYFLNLLQSLPTKKNYFITLNPDSEVAPFIQEFNYDHPKFDRLAIRAQRELDSIQGNGGVYFAGAWTRYGFHEDGILSAVKVAALLGVTAPWNKSHQEKSL